MLAKNPRNASFPKLYKLDYISKQSLQALKDKFDELPLDPYLAGNFRFRRFSMFSVSALDVTRMPHSTFYQALEHNNLLGGVERWYPELGGILVRNRKFREVLQKFSMYCQLYSRQGDFSINWDKKLECKPIEIGVHQIRITCSLGEQGNPTPEGIHKDGVDVVGILCINRDNIKGGKSSLFYPNPDKKIFTRVLTPGEFLIIDDKRLWHNASPIVPKQLLQRGFRDVFVLTYSRAS